jgi:hypothetical protein
MKGYKTVAFNVIMGIIALLAVLNPEADLPDGALVSAGLDNVEAAFVAVWTVGNLILRAITSSKIFNSPEKAAPEKVDEA